MNGQYGPVEQARISVLDLGVTRSDGTYDVVHVWDGRFFRLDAHLDRFTASMARLRLDPGHDRAQIEDILHGCVRHAGLRAAYVSMTCTRGRMPPGSRDLRTARPTFYCYAVPFIWPRTPEQQQAGASLWISDLLRIPPASVDPHQEPPLAGSRPGPARGLRPRCRPGGAARHDRGHHRGPPLQLTSGWSRRRQRPAQT